MSLIAIDWKPDQPKLRKFGMVGTVVFLALMAWAIFRSAIFGIHLSGGGQTLTVVLLAALAAHCLLGALAAPGSLRPLFLGLTFIGLPIGWVVSHIVLAVVYYGLVTPMGLTMRLFGRDPMCRKFDPQASTYWTTRAKVADPGRYFRQY